MNRFISNLKKLIAGTIDCIEQIFKKYPGCDDILPNQTEYRCFLLLTNLITFEISALFCPEIIKNDLWDLFLQRGGGLFQSYFFNKGRATHDLQHIKRSMLLAPKKNIPTIKLSDRELQSKDCFYRLNWLH